MDTEVKAEWNPAIGQEIVELPEPRVFYYPRSGNRSVTKYFSRLLDHNGNWNAWPCDEYGRRYHLYPYYFARADESSNDLMPTADNIRWKP